MRFGTFGSAQAKRPAPGTELTDSSQGFRESIENNVDAEALAVLTQACACKQPFSHPGRFCQFDDIVVAPPTAQRPHPPFWMGAGSDRSVRQVAERGYNMLLGQHDLADDVIRWVQQYKAGIEAGGRRYDPMQVAVARAVHFADTPEE